MKQLQAGEVAPKNGDYKIVGARGAVIGTVTMKKGDKLPPTRSSGQHYEIE